MKQTSWLGESWSLKQKAQDPPCDGDDDDDDDDDDADDEQEQDEGGGDEADVVESDESDGEDATDSAGSWRYSTSHMRFKCFTFSRSFTAGNRSAVRLIRSNGKAT